MDKYNLILSFVPPNCLHLSSSYITDGPLNLVSNQVVGVFPLKANLAEEWAQALTYFTLTF